MRTEHRRRLALVALARETFDVGAAREVTARARDVLVRLGHEVIGRGEPVCDQHVLNASIGRLGASAPDRIVVLQGTFTSATTVRALAAAVDCPIVVWGFPEPPGSDRLRLNSLCGLTLAMNGLRRVGHDARWVFGDPAKADIIEQLAAALEPDAVTVDSPSRAALPPATSIERDRARAVADAVDGAVIGRIGTPPAGFGPCEVDAGELGTRLGVHVADHDLDDLFRRAHAATADEIDAARRRIAEATVGIDDLPADQVEHGARLDVALDQLIAECRWAGVAARCWPECFTQGGAAICTALSMRSDAGVATGCEADVLGAASDLILRQLSDRPPFLADLVEVTRSEGTGTFWHCGVAAPSLARPGDPVRVSVHPNRRIATSNDFELAPGRVTIARLTERPGGALALVIGGGEILDRAHRLQGTTAIVHFDRSTDEVLHAVLDGGLDHHLTLAYGDHAAALEALAHHWHLDVIDL